MRRSFLLLALFQAVCAPLVWGATSNLIARSHTDVTPVLELSVSSQASSELAFGRVTPSALGPVLSPLQTVILRVRSSTGEPYVVAQAFAGPLQNAKGDVMGLGQVKFRAVPEKNEGTGVDVLTPVLPSAQTVYVSDDKGAGQTVTLEYQLEIPPSQAPGDYSSLLTFTVSTL